MSLFVVIAFVFFVIIILALITSGSSSSGETWKGNIWKDAAGKEGEREVSWTAKTRLPSFEVIRNLYVPQGEGRATEIDMVLVHNSGIYVLEIKNYSGWVFGSETQRYWTKVHYQEKHQFYNPLMQNRGHVNSLQRYLKLDPGLFHSYVVFTGDCEFKSLEYNPAYHKIVKREQLARQILEDASKYGMMMSDGQVSAVYDMLMPLSDPSPERRQEQARTYQAAKSHGEVTGTRCPLCGGQLVLRTARATGERFWGCSNYPNCKYTRQYTDENHHRPRTYR